MHFPIPLDSKLLEEFFLKEILIMQVWIHFMCSKVELVTHSNSNLGDWGESRAIKFLKFGTCSLLISSVAIFYEYFYIVLKGPYISALKGGSHDGCWSLNYACVRWLWRPTAVGYNFHSGSKSKCSV